jgi:hypothetical protein
MTKALFISAKLKSLGETFTEAIFAQELEEGGWNTRFLAFEYAARFLDRRGTQVTLLGNQKAQNYAILRHSIQTFKPDVVFIADMYLMQSEDTAAVWSNEWLFELCDAPIITFDHIKFHPDAHTLLVSFNRIIEGPGSVPYEYHIESLPAGVGAVIRPCPANDPDDLQSDRVFKYRARYCEPRERASARITRDKMGIASNEKLIFIPISSWAMQATQELGIPYYAIYPRLLGEYFGRSKSRIRIVYVCSELSTHQRCENRITHQFINGLSFSQMQDILQASDLVLSDNVVSSSLCRAVMSCIPAGAFMSSVDTIYESNRAHYISSFSLTPFVKEALDTMEREAPNSIYPFLLYPLGWMDALQPLLRENIYSATFQQIELFDQICATECLENLLFDDATRRGILDRQEYYADRVDRLPSACVLTEKMLHSIDSGRKDPWIA